MDSNFALPEDVVDLVQQIIASERMQSERYRHYYHLIPDTRVREELIEHSDDEIHHFTILGEKLVEYGEIPTIGMPADKEIVSIGSLSDLSVKELLEYVMKAELDGFAKYQGLLAELVKANDTGFRVLVEQIILKEEEHIRDINRLLRIYS